MMARLTHWLILLCLPLIFGIACVLGYYAWGKLSYAGYSCGSFAMADAEIGWVLAPGATSCLGAREPFASAPPWFHSTVHTDGNGFRSAAPGGQTPANGIFAVGDSWTFGFGLDHQDSYPGQLAVLSGLPVVTVASPAYSAAQAILLAERWAPRLRPRAIVYLDKGFGNRAACSGRHRPLSILKPCYWQPTGATEAELVLPPGDHVLRAADHGILPGGVLGAGELGWRYFVWARPITLAQQTLVRLGLASGFAHDFRAVGVDEMAIRRATLRHLVRLAATADVPVLLLDPGDLYAGMLEQLPPEQTVQILRVGAEEWNRAADAPAKALAPEQREIPHDGHYGPGMNRLIAEFVTAKLRQLHVGG